MVMTQVQVSAIRINGSGLNSSLGAHGLLDASKIEF